jgi:hypothetical protein
MVDSLGFLPQANILEGDGIFHPELVQPVDAIEVTAMPSITLRIHRGRS